MIQMFVKSFAGCLLTLMVSCALAAILRAMYHESFTYYLIGSEVIMSVISAWVMFGLNKVQSMLVAVINLAICSGLFFAKSFLMHLLS